MNPEDLNTAAQEVEYTPRLSKNMAAMVVVAIIVVVLALMYVWASKINRTTVDGGPQKGNTLTAEEFSKQVRPGVDQDAAELNAGLATLRFEGLDDDLRALETDLRTMVAN